MATEDISLRVRIDQIEAALASIPGITKKEMDRVAKAAAEAWENTEKYAKKAAKAQEKAQAEAARGAQKSFDDIKKGATVAFGGIVGDVEDVGGALAALGPVGAGVVVGIAAITAAVAAIPVAAALAVGGIVEITRSAKDALEAIEKVGGAEIITPDQKKAVDEANAALDVLNAAFGELVVSIAADLSPKLLEAALFLSDLTFSAVEAFSKFAEGRDLIETFAIATVAAIADSVEKFLLLNGVIQNVIRAVGGFAEAMGAPIPYISDLDKRLDAFNMQIGRSITGFDGLDDGAKTYSGRAAELKTKIEKLAEEERKKREDTEKLKEAEKKAHEAEKARAESMREQKRIVEGLKDAEAALADTIASATGATLTEEQKIVAAYAARIAKIDEVIAKAKEQGVQGAELTALEAKADEARTAALEERAKKEEEVAQKTVDGIEIVVQKTSEAVGIVTAHWGSFWGEQLAHLEEWLSNYDQTYGKIVDAVGTIGAAYEALHRDRLAGIMDERAALVDAIKSQTGAERAASVAKLKATREEANEERKKIAAGFRIAQAAAVASAIVDAAKSAVALIPAFAFLGPGAPFAAAGVAAAGLAVQLATIKSQKLKFHSGYDPSEYPATLARGEGVANVRAMTTPGFGEQLRAANAGVSVAPQPIVIALNDRTLQVLSARTSRVQSGARVGIGSATQYGGR